MCGISGIVSLNNQKIYQEEIDKLTDYLTHRGPNGRGIWINKESTVAYGHRRLSILDLSEAGKQPMISGDGNLVLVLNGEIYNFLEIRDELKQLGFAFKSESDTEVILYAYQYWGLDMLPKFNGMWAFALFDKQAKTVILSRDRFGVKPLYYFFDGDMLVFASEVQAIHKLIPHKVSINENVVQAILNFNQDYHGSESSYLNEVKSLPGGCNLRVHNTVIKVETWYNLNKISVPNKFGEQVEVLKGLLSDACKIRLRSDVPIGTCLSGGVDSGSISAIINSFKGNESERFSNFTHRSFCAGFPDTSIDETDDAVRLSKQLNLNLDVLSINAPKPAELEEAMRYCDGPMPAFAFFPIWKLYKHIREQGIVVTLDGQGPDEMLGGYYKGYEAIAGAWEMKNFSWLYDVYKTYGALHPNAPEWVKIHLNMYLKSKGVKYKQSLKLPVKKILSLLELYHFKPLPNQKAIENFAYRKVDKSGNTFENALFSQFFVNPLPFLLHQYDRASMANGVECRMPFLDFRVVEFLFSIPPISKVGAGYTKRILRESVKGILPNETRLQKLKTGFNAPTIEWFKHDLNDWFHDQINSASFQSNPYFDGREVQKEFAKTIGTDEAWKYNWKYWSHIHLSWWLKSIQA